MSSGKKFSKKELLFIKAYLTDPNATKAAISAGYSEKSAKSIGHENLTKPHIKEAIEFGFKKITDGMDISAERVLRELSRIAFTTMKDLAVWNESGVTFKSSEEISADAACAISEVSETVTQAGGTLKIRQHDKVRALEMLGKHLKLFTERHEHSGPDGKPIEFNDHEAAAKLSAILNAARSRKVNDSSDGNAGD